MKSDPNSLWLTVAELNAVSAAAVVNTAPQQRPISVTQLNRSVPPGLGTGSGPPSATAKSAVVWTPDELTAIMTAQDAPPDAGCRTEPSCPEFRPRDKIVPKCHVKQFNSTATNNKFIFLREIGGANCLVGFLQSVIADGTNGNHWGATLIIDEEVRLECPIVIPAGFTLAGTGINGAGRLRFSGDFIGIPAIRFQDLNGGNSTIRDLAIIGPGLSKPMKGIKIGTSAFVSDNDPDPPGRFRFHRVRVSGFGTYGMQGGLNARYVTIDSCQLIENGVNIQLIRRCDGWRIRDTIITDARTWGVDIGANINDFVTGEFIFGSLTDVLISGCLFLNNGAGAIQVQPGAQPSLTFGVFIFGNGFEGNGGIAVRVAHKNAGVRIVANFLSEGELFVVPVDPSADPVEPRETHIGFNAIRTTIPQLEILNLMRTPI